MEFRNREDLYQRESDESTLEKIQILKEVLIIRAVVGDTVPSVIVLNQCFSR